MHNAQLKMEALLPSLKFKLEFIGALHRNAKCKGQNAKLEFSGANFVVTL